MKRQHLVTAACAALFAAPLMAGPLGNVGAAGNGALNGTLNNGRHLNGGAAGSLGAEGQGRVVRPDLRPARESLGGVRDAATSAGTDARDRAEVTADGARQRVDGAVTSNAASARGAGSASGAASGSTSRHTPGVSGGMSGTGSAGGKSIKADGNAGGNASAEVGAGR